MISLGTSAPSGPVRVNDAATLIGSGTPVQILTVTPDGAEWTCGPVPADTLSCQIPGAVMTPGTSRHFDVTLTVSPNERFENCARGSFGPAPGDDIVYPFGEACDQGGTDIHVEKTGDLRMPAGAALHVRDHDQQRRRLRLLGHGAHRRRAWKSEASDGWKALRSRRSPRPSAAPREPTTLPFACDANLSLGAGESRVHQVTVVIPDDGRFANTPNGLARAATAWRCCGPARR